jgi:AcrR family transcriptional regulator
MPRKRTIPDEALLDTALALVREAGPDALTFARLAPVAGLAASTIVQRFGTKPALLRAALSRAWDLLDEATARAVATASPDESGAIDMLVQLSGQYRAGDEFADQLLLLREDLRDPVLRARGRAWIATLSAAVERRLPPTMAGVDGLGELVVAHWQGTLTVWSFQRDGTLVDAVRAALEGLFARLASNPQASGMRVDAGAEG